MDAPRGYRAGTIAMSRPVSMIVARVSRNRFPRFAVLSPAQKTRSVSDCAIGAGAGSLLRRAPRLHLNEIRRPVRQGGGRVPRSSTWCCPPPCRAGERRRRCHDRWRYGHARKRDWRGRGCAEIVPSGGRLPCAVADTTSKFPDVHGRKPCASTPKLSRSRRWQCFGCV